MYEKIIEGYINNLTEDQIREYSSKNNIRLNDDEVKILYVYAKNYWQIFLKGRPDDLIEELRKQINADSFNKMYSLYLQYKKPGN